MVLSENFENGLPFSTWSISENSELGHLIGNEKSRFFRFHPKYKSEKVITPSMDLSSGYYRLYFNWSENGFGNPDSTIFSLSVDEGVNWKKIGKSGGGNGSVWQLDSIEIGESLGDICLVRLQYEGTGKYPATYFNLDDFVIQQVDKPTGISLQSLNLKVQLFPNPATKNLNFIVENQQLNDLSLSIFDISGKTVFEKRLNNESIIQEKINIQDFLAGVYFLKIYSNIAQNTYKVIVE